MKIIITGLVLVALLAFQWAGAAPIAEASDHRTTICHVPPGNPGNAHTITVGTPAVPAHLDHGDNIGACRDEPTATPTPSSSRGAEADSGGAASTGASGRRDILDTQVAQAPVKSLPVTGGVEGDLSSGGNAWAAWLLVAGFLSTGMAVMRIRGN